MKQWTRQPYARIRQSGADASYSEIRVVNPSRGLNLLVADILSNDKEATNGTKNIEYVEGGAARKRMGYEALDEALNNPGRGLGVYKSEAASYPVTCDGTTLRKYDSGTWSNLSGSVTIDSSADITFTPLFEKLYAWDGVNSGIVFNGTTLSQPGTMPKAKFSVVYKGFHVASGVDGQPFRLYFAPVGEPSRFTYDPANNSAATDDIDPSDATEVPGASVFSGDASPRAIDINKNDGQRVTGLGFFQDVLIVFKEDSIYQLYFDASGGFVVERITNSYGAVNHGAIVSVENDCYFLTEKGVYVLGNEPNYFASIRTNELSSRVKTLLQRINTEYWSRCRAYYHDDRYFLTVPIGASEECNAMIVYDRRFYAWSYWTNIAANDMTVFKDSTNETHFYFTEYGTNDVCEFTPGVYNDKGEAIEAVFITRAFEGKQVDKEKYWYSLRPIFRLTTGAVQISFIAENGTVGRPVAVAPVLTGGLGVDQFGSLLLGASQQDNYSLADLGVAGADEEEFSSEASQSHTVYDIGIGVDSRTMKVKFENNGVNETFTVLGWILLYQEKDHARFDGEYVIR